MRNKSKPLSASLGLGIVTLGFLALLSGGAIAQSVSPACPEAGSAGYSGVMPVIHPYHPSKRGTVITVTGVDDNIDGDVSSVSNLLANPGKDGTISLREAITATNNSPGVYTIDFAPNLKGAAITISGINPYFLTGGNVLINGDIDGDGSPDISIVGSGMGWGFAVESSSNTLYGLTIENFSAQFSDGVILGAYFGGTPIFLVNSTISNNTFSNLVIKNAYNGIELNTGIPPGVQNPAWAGDSWVNTTIIDNTIESDFSGISLGLASSKGDTLKGTVIANNTVVVTNPLVEHGSSAGIGITNGLGVGDLNDSVTNTLVAYNTVIDNGTVQNHLVLGISFDEGVDGGAGNNLENTTIVGNRVQLQSILPGHIFGTTGIAVGTGDTASDDLNSSITPVVYPDNNTIRGLFIISNLVTGGGKGIDIEGGTPAQFNMITNILIAGNTIDLTFKNAADGIYVSATEGVEFKGDKASAYDQVTNLLIESNSVHLSGHPYASNFTDAGIFLWGGMGIGGRISNASIASNYVNTSALSIQVIGGGVPASAYPGTDAAVGDVVTGLSLTCNTIQSPPTDESLQGLGVKGIDFTGGYLNATGSAVRNVTLDRNVVAGVLNDYSAFGSVGPLAAGNTVGPIDVKSAAYTSSTTTLPVSSTTSEVTSTSTLVSSTTSATSPGHQSSTSAVTMSSTTNSASSFTTSPPGPIGYSLYFGLALVLTVIMVAFALLLRRKPKRINLKSD